jgi:DNA-directed RNA polymerase subunit omega
MIDALRDDDIIRKVGGRFKLAALIQKRWLELLQGSRPMVEGDDMTPIETVIEEIRQDKLDIDYAASNLAMPPRD